MPNFDGIPDLYVIKKDWDDLYVRVGFNDATSQEFFEGIDVQSEWELLHIQKEWEHLQVKSEWETLHAVLNWINFDHMFHVHDEYNYFIEIPDGSKLEFTVNDSKFEKQKVPGSIELYINGLRNFLDVDYEETDDGIKLIGDTIIKSGDFIWCHYRKIVVGEGELI